VSLRFGVHFSGCGVAAFTALFVYLLSFCQRAAEDGFAADDGSVSRDGRNFRCCTVGELLRDWDLVSVRAVQEKCDEKGGGARLGKIPCVRQRWNPTLFAKCAKRMGHPARDHRAQSRIR
jgi:hypothetical protein